MSKSILAIIFAFFAIFAIVKPSFAAVLFEDNFNSTPLTKWNEAGGIWQVNNGKYGSYVPNNPSSATSYAEVDIAVPNYTIELDLYPVKGTDRNIRFRTGSNIGEYDLHFTSDGIATNFGVDNHSVILVNHPLVDNFSYHVKIVLENKNFKVYIDGNLIFDVTDANYEFDGSEKFYLTVTTGGVPTEVYFDNISITSIDNSLPVPLVKQIDPLWANDIYDSANLWASSSPTIGRWGCAITSAVMVLNYNNITKLPDGTNLNPSTLNNYLLSVPGGYKRNGATNWEKIAAMTKEAKPSNPNFAFDALKYVKGDNSLSSVESDIQNNIPDILEVPLYGGQHFVVAKYVDGSNVLINDPGFNRNDLSEYGNNFVSTRRFIPSNTDLSYLVFDVDPNIDIQLKDTNGNAISIGELEFPIADPFGLLTNTIGALRVISYPEPEDGEYMVEVSSDSDAKYSLDGYLYDQSGKSKVFNKGGIVGVNNKDFYNISFNKNNVGQSIIVDPITTFDSLISDLASLYQAGNISKKGSYNYLTNKIQQAKNYSITNIQRSKDLLLNIRQQLVDDKRRGIDVFASQFLVEQIDILLITY